jgi:hypothetical protein
MHSLQRLGTILRESREAVLDPTQMLRLLEPALPPTASQFMFKL